ncbi:hypothetical protein ENH_00016200 [Eimeria necatrix]|uniref:Uncharacterized protein n=1 Tax=Eimeria necatrix TaxID=51315 RepID=U6MLC7_9EIME|nr:hypothetical protein ENH_00016200 [Eimeria necatrix]CDJ62465.1 hypothetical protein ENH_00016200 [Eimeria necatrix]
MNAFLFIFVSKKEIPAAEGAERLPRVARRTWAELAACWRVFFARSSSLQQQQQQQQQQHNGDPPFRRCFLGN